MVRSIGVVSALLGGQPVRAQGVSALVAAGLG
jgi:hypothetical protein